MKKHISSIEIMGQCVDDFGQPIELDMFVENEEGRRFSLTVMTLGRYEYMKQVQPDMGEDVDAPRVMVLNEYQIVLDSLVELLKSPDMRVFSPYLFELEP